MGHFAKIVDLFIEVVDLFFQEGGSSEPPELPWLWACYSSFSDCNFGQKLFIISLSSIVMTLCYIIIIILSAYNVRNKAEQCPNKSILKVILILHFVI